MSLQVRDERGLRLIQAEQICSTGYEMPAVGVVSKSTNRIFIVLIVLSNTVGNLFLALGMKHMPAFQAVSPQGYFLALVESYWILSGVALLIVWMIAQLSMFTWADLTYVLPVTASAYVITAILSKFFLADQISIARWAGIALISVGVMFVSETPERATPKTERVAR